MTRKRLILYAVGVVLVIALLAICVIARGRPSTTSSTTPEKGKQSIVAPPTLPGTNELPTSTSVSLTGMNGQPTTTAGSGGQCGTVNLSLGGMLLGPANAAQEEDCFWQAYQQCRPASLIITANGTDVISSHTFSVAQKQGGCAISDTVMRSVNGQPGQQNTYNCARLDNTETGLHFADCGGEGTIDIPS